ncbi:MAG: LysR family transcriptional regulator [Thermogemmatispora sp.]|uniref:LysR family transcriptional regulator n=1 Tax=Thermogemmatispora sp. TaxID=1968838 RepID=UPI0026018EB0|nr:LysR family transcriptional regulator [Thermogemmatispora sp.]MBX5457569.1 LysR family transcriptional regulator [Thermogemmatispora sp.]
MVDLEWYRSFIAIYRAGTVSGAARALLLTQPAVTQHLAALEAAVGEPLFLRAPRRMIPTARGKELYNQVVQAIETLEQVSQNLGTGQEHPPLLRCGAPREYFQEQVLKRLHSLPYRLWLQFGETADLVNDLEHGRLEAVIATQQLASRDLEFVRLEDEYFVLVGPATLALPEELKEAAARGERGPLEEWLTSQRWVAYGPELPIIRRFWLHCFERRPTFQAALVLPDLHAIRLAIEQGYGISVLPDYLCRGLLEEGRLRLLWEPPQPVTNELWLAYRRIDRNDARIRALKRLVLS